MTSALNGVFIVMKIAFIICMLQLGLASYCWTAEAVYLVKAVVIELQKSSEDQTATDVKNSPQNSSEIWLAVLKIDTVFEGSADINGSRMSLPTSDEIPLGNTRVINPKLQVGDVGIFAIQRYKNGELSWIRGFHVIDGAPLPLIRGRDAAYERVLQQLAKVREMGSG